jgi:sulfur-oxidizing protein SoxY
MPDSLQRPPSRHLRKRRNALALAAAALLTPLRALAEVINVKASELVAMKLSSEGIALEFPSLADTGAAVPLQATINAPAGRKIDVIEVFLPENPNTRALRLKLVEPQARFVFSTRLRLAGSQDVWVVVTFTDGSRRGATAPTVVTSSACFDAS